MHPDERRERTLLPRSQEAGGEGDGGRSDPGRDWTPDSAVAGAPSRLRPAMRMLAEALDPEGDRAPAASGSPDAAKLSLDDVGEALARMRAGLLGAGDAQDPATSGLRARRHAELDAAAMEAAAAILEHRSVQQQRFLQDISHDLRSPLNSILFLADALRSEHSGPLNPVQARQVDVLFMASVTLVKMVNDVIDFARLGGATSMLSASIPFSVETVMSEVDRLVGPLVLHNDVRLRTEMRASGLRTGDPQILNRVLLNLVSNAVQILPDGGSVEVVVADEPDGSLRVDVVDDGEDAPIDRIRTVLDADDPYSLAGETRGWTHGLGLSISARLVRATGGTITVDRDPSGGTAFRVVLPFPPL